MNIRDFWWTAVGRNGDPVPVPFDVRTPTSALQFVWRGLVVSGLVIALSAPGLMTGRLTKAGLVHGMTNVLGFALVCGLATVVFLLALELAIWTASRRKLGEGLEATAAAWSPSELDAHIRDIQARHAKSEGYEKLLHARHLTWLGTKRA